MTTDRSACTSDRHGDENAYTNYGCTCTDAREDRRINQKRRREGRHTRPYVDVTGPARRLQALAALGWSCRDLAPRLGCSPQLVERHRTGRLARIDRASAGRYASLYEELQGTPGPSKLARQRATQAGWAPPLLWNDGTLDNPQARPVDDRPPTDRRQRIDLDDLQRFTTAGGSVEQYAARAGVDPLSITRAQDRAKQRAPTDAAIQRAREAVEEPDAPVNWAESPTMQRALEHAFGR